MVVLLADLFLWYLVTELSQTIEQFELLLPGSIIVEELKKIINKKLAKNNLFYQKKNNECEMRQWWVKTL